MADSRTIRIGPFGSRRGRYWDEQGRSEIVQIFVSHDHDGIHSIQFQYYENDTLVLSESHGEISGDKFDVVRFNYPSEYLTCVSGFLYEGPDVEAFGGFRCGSEPKLSNPPNVTSITFATNVKAYGPFGAADKEIRLQLEAADKMNPFQLGAADKVSLFQLGASSAFGVAKAAHNYKEFRCQLGQDRQFGGFFGFADHFLGSIGVYFRPICKLKIQQKPIGSRTEEEDAEALAS